MVHKKLLILDNIRSAHNVGAIMRTADGFALTDILCVGVTPYPELPQDTRLPHVRRRADAQITKTALGAEKSLNIRHIDSIYEAIKMASKESAGPLLALEQTPRATELAKHTPTNEWTLVVGNELDGVSKKVLEQADATLEIPMHGSKESLNVSVATGIALFHLTTGKSR